MHFVLLARALSLGECFLLLARYIFLAGFRSCGALSFVSYGTRFLCHSARFFILERVSYCGAAIRFCFAWRFAFGVVFFVGNWRTVATQLAMRVLCSGAVSRFFPGRLLCCSGTALFLPLADSSMQKLQDAESFCNYIS